MTRVRGCRRCNGVVSLTGGATEVATEAILDGTARRPLATACGAGEESRRSSVRTSRVTAVAASGLSSARTRASLADVAP